MTCTVVIDGSDGNSPLRSPSRTLRSSCNMRNSISRDFGKYELTVLLISQLSYIPITTTMLSTAFYEPSKSTCLLLNQTGAIESVVVVDPEMVDADFNSILLEWGEACQQSALTAFMSTTLMAGALSGSFIAGWLADAYGRLLVVKACLLLVCVANGMFSFAAPLSWVLSAAFLFTLGAGCGGYMVTNLVLLIECLDHPGSRLLAVSLNGWSLSMIFVAFLARLTQHWFFFHFFTALLAFLAFTAFQFSVMESCRWLAGVHRTAEARSTAMRIMLRRSEAVHSASDCQWWEILGFSQPALSLPSKDETARKYTYSDLFSHPSVYAPLIALCYCFVSSSVVSFGFYFNTDALPGNRYLNMASMGLMKFILGFLPFAVSSYVGRRPIISVSVGFACLGAWLAVVSQLCGASTGHWSLAALSLMVSAVLDPAWKINHLYSAELFPTVVRNMARAVCNVGARLGSVAAPMVVHLRTIHYLIPYLAFAVFLTVQLVVVVVLIPETKNKPLPEALPFSSNEKARSEEMLGLNESNPRPTDI